MALSKRGFGGSSALPNVMTEAAASALITDYDKRDINVKLEYRNDYEKRDSVRSTAGSRWRAYTKAKDLAEYIEITDNDSLFRGGYAGKGFADLRYDVSRGLVKLIEPKTISKPTK